MYSFLPPVYSLINPSTSFGHPGVIFSIVVEGCLLANRKLISNKCILSRAYLAWKQNGTGGQNSAPPKWWKPYDTSLSARRFLWHLQQGSIKTPWLLLLLLLHRPNASPNSHTCSTSKNYLFLSYGWCCGKSLSIIARRISPQQGRSV